jgi:transcription-repair coupling factor (superfamily II helicase)
MPLQGIAAAYRDDDRTVAIANDLGREGIRVHISGLSGSSAAMLAAGIHTRTPNTHVFILNDAEEAAYFENDLSALFPRKQVLLFPASYKKQDAFDETNSTAILTRTQTLNQLMYGHKGGDLIVTYPEAMPEMLVKAEKLKENTLQLKTGEKVDVDFMLDLLIEYGFERADFVYEPGEFSIRGGIIDIFSFGNEHPYRVELFGEEVESLRTFDPESQLSLRKISSLSIIPNINTHFVREQQATIFDFLPEDTVLWVKDLTFMKEVIGRLHDKAAAEMRRLSTLKQDPDHPFFGKQLEGVFADPKIFFQRLLANRLVEFVGEGALKADSKYEFNTLPHPSFNRNIELLIKDLQQHAQKGYHNYIIAENPRQIERFYSIFQDLGAQVQFVAINASLSAGFLDSTLKIACYTDHQIFDRYHKYKARSGYSRGKALTLRALRDLNPGDYVTHIDHGVGVFSGLERMNVGGQQQEMVRIVYKDKDLLYVSINSLHKIAKFSGKEGQVPKLNKLGSDAWEKLKRKTKTKVRDIAQELIKLYAQRKMQKGFAFSPDGYLQNELEASFMYEDTPDQYKATQDVKADMEKPVPMDRLICGDVGFGKTEVAVRAAFKAVCDSKQVAILVPTTILAWQHFNTFSKRLEGFPCRVDFLNRFKSYKDKKEVMRDVKDGKIDILIGTHAMLNKELEFKKLGLLIIDEEQKFGVSAKEKIRGFAANVDTLTLTATPIPRTLKFSMMGARDLSNIQTPPPNRQPVTTEVKQLDGEFIREAIEFEVFRGGQVFFVHNRVKDIHEFEVMLHKLVPHISIGVAHGQMEGDKLEEIMLDFINGKFDVLLCTNIIESGLDIPNANTIFIHNAHQFGLSDLHQLRGRVGRSNKKAFCYLIAPPKSTLTQEARQRLRTLEEYSELGSGFNIAMRDLDIRGAGNLLGAEQSGFVAEIGFEMYHKILDETIQELKFTEFRDLFKEQIETKQEFVTDCSIETDCEMLIPFEYVQNTEERLRLYTEMDNISKEEDLQTFAQRLEDRFGQLPKQVRELFDGLRLRWVCKKLGFERVILKGGKLRCYFIENPKSPYYETPLFQVLIGFVQKQSRQCHLKQTNNNLMLVYDQVRAMHQAREILHELLTAITPQEAGAQQ